MHYPRGAGLVAAGLLTAITLTGCTSSPPNPFKEDQPDEGWAIEGTFTLSDFSAAWLSGRPCSGEGGYSDIGPGTDVKVLDGEGKIIAADSLGFGKASMDSGTCKFDFTVSNVPEGLDIYQIEVADRGTLTYTQDELDTDVSLTLGG